MREIFPFAKNTMRSTDTIIEGWGGLGCTGDDIGAAPREIVRV